MNNEQFLLTKLSEECAGICQASSNAIQFGRESENPLHPEKTNLGVIQDKIENIAAIVQLLEDEYNFGFLFNIGGLEVRRSEVLKQLEISKQSGYVTIEDKQCFTEFQNLK